MFDAINYNMCNNILSEQLILQQCIHSIMGSSVDSRVDIGPFTRLDHTLR